MKLKTEKKRIIIVILALIVALIVIVYYLITNNMPKNNIEENIAIVTNEIQLPEEEQEIVIHISGCIVESGLIKLKENACRIADAIEAAGGLTPEADIEQINLAYPLTDGQKIQIPSKNDKKEDTEYVSTNSGNNIIKSETKSAGGTTMVNINNATQLELEALPGIGPSIAQKIIEYKNTNGKYKSIEDLKNVQGIGDSKFENIKSYIKVK